MFEHAKLGVKQLGGSLNSGLGEDGIASVLQVLSSTINQPSHDGLLDQHRRGDNGSDFFDGLEVTVVHAVRVGHIPEKGLEMFQIVLVKSDDEGKLVSGIGSSLLLRLVANKT